MFQDLQQFLDGAEYGVIYFSLGSNVKSSGLPQATLDCFMKVFEKLRYRVLWKFEEDLTHNIKNLRVEQWVSQKRVLGKDRLKLSIGSFYQDLHSESTYLRMDVISSRLYLPADRTAGWLHHGRVHRRTFYAIFS